VRLQNKGEVAGIITFMRHKCPVLTVKKLLKSVSIYGSYRKNKTGVPFLEHPGTPLFLSIVSVNGAKVFIIITIIIGSTTATHCCLVLLLQFWTSCKGRKPTSVLGSR